mmetsp:Transcript_20751/g.57973  ORF Transcript_20751/g.57973 Transcript_20751/m.57973 type:complete len:329 (+) Transcript_20751:3025-4011(+)
MNDQRCKLLIWARVDPPLLEDARDASFKTVAICRWKAARRCLVHWARRALAHKRSATTAPSSARRHFRPLIPRNAAEIRDAAWLSGVSSGCIRLRRCPRNCSLVANVESAARTASSNARRASMKTRQRSRGLSAACESIWNPNFAGDGGAAMFAMPKRFSNTGKNDGRSASPTADGIRCCSGTWRTPKDSWKRAQNWSFMSPPFLNRARSLTRAALAFFCMRPSRVASSLSIQPFISSGVAGIFALGASGSTSWTTVKPALVPEDVSSKYVRVPDHSSTRPFHRFKTHAQTAGSLLHSSITLPARARVTATYKLLSSGMAMITRQRRR